VIQGNRIKKATQIALTQPDVLWSRRNRSPRIWNKTNRYAIQAKIIKKCQRKSQVEPQRRQPRSAPTPRPLGVGLGRSIAAGELSVPVVAAVCGLPEVIVNASVTRRSGR
jgi:hypothetical protein